MRSTTFFDTLQIAKYMLPVVAVALMAMLAFNIFQFSITGNSVANTAASSGIGYHSSVCRTIMRANGEVENLGCSPNLFTETGRNITRDALGLNIGGSVNVIGLANETGAAQATTDTFLQGEWSSCGLSKAAGTYTTTGTSVGNWTIARTFTSTCDIVTINATGLFNDTTTGACPAGSAGNCIFAENTFVTATLQASDQITITWYIWVT